VKFAQIRRKGEMETQQRKAEQFRKLHVAGNPLVLYNVWDPGSAKAAASAGAKAIGTSSWAVAEALGFSDGEHTPLELVIDNLRRVAGATELPVTVDLESGYGEDPETVGKTIALAIGAGAVGCNLEDSFPATGELREANDQVRRIRSARQAAEAKINFFINARCDVFFRGPSEKPSQVLVTKAIERARLYQQAGADGLFLPGLKDKTLIAQIAKASPMPLNILVSDATSKISLLAKKGVARVSYGGNPYAETLKAFEQAARKAHA
jgi:2-methylisocitrate lyase-like PEP mutase family enzyme